jgi:GH15 family glucan-1,4-alpha-glucosidase
MPRDIPIGNGRMLVTFDGRYQLRDIYFPYVGAENHSPGDVCRTGLWVDGAFAWLSDDEWRRTINYAPETLVTSVELQHDGLEVAVSCRDTVDRDRDLMIRRIAVKNLADRTREIRIFFHYDLHIEGNGIGDTFAYRPDVQAVVAYKRRRYFLMNGQVGEGQNCTVGIASWATGIKELHGAEGTWRDAEDGLLGRNSIAQGSVDGTIALHAPGIESQSEALFFHWLALGKTWQDVAALDDLVRLRGPESLLSRTENYWHLWVNKEPADFADLDESLGGLYKRSLLIIQTQVDERGAIVAANDSDILRQARDTYSYVWPRDGALVACAFIQAGYNIPAARFFEFCAHAVTDDGYLLHKYNPGGSLASSWHPWLDPLGRPQLPIQEDETALVVYALWEHYRRFRDVDFLRALYRRLIVNPANFMVTYRDPHTGLPSPSWDLWEERHGITAFTTGTVWAGLEAAGRFARLFGDELLCRKYETAAREIKEAALQHLWSPAANRFSRMINVGEDGAIVRDDTIESSVFGLWYFGMLPPDDALVTATVRTVRERLWVKTDIGGCARYDHDWYQRVTDDFDAVPGNPWFVCTLWLAQYDIAVARSRAELASARDLLAWARKHALPSGVLAEQADPFSGAPLSVSPLTWSHGTYCLAVREYVAKWNALGA